MSHTPQKNTSKMCKSPKNTTFKQEKIEYDHSTNCTVVGSNNLNLVKKPQVLTNMSPVYSNPSPSYPQSPYSSPASLKSPSPNLKPPTPQPNFPVMQIIHNNHPLLTRQIQTSQPQNIIKLKPHLNILPKPSASPQSPKSSVSPQIVIPNHQQATIMPTAQPLLLNQMSMLTPGVQFILRPQTATKIPTPMPTAAPQGLILQPSGQQLLHIQPPRSQPMVRVLTNGMQLAPSTTTYVTQMANQQPISAAQISQQHIVNSVQPSIQKKKPKQKPKKKLDLANIMKLSGIGDEDDILFESDASQSESEQNSIPGTPQPPNIVQPNTVTQANLMHTTDTKKIGNIQISAMPQPTINTAPTPVVQVLNQNFQSGMISNSSSQATAQASIPFNSFITPNFTINNGLMLQRSGGFKLTVGEDGRLVLQHDPQLQTQDIQSQLILQSLLGLNGGLVLQPSMDQQTVQQTVQTIQQQSVQTIQQQTVQSQTIQTVQQQTVPSQAVQHALQSLQPQIQQSTVQQTIQHQTVSQPLTALQQPMQIVQPQPIHSIHSQVQPTVHSAIQSQVHSLQSQIQGQIQSLLQQQQQNHTVQNQPVQSPIQTLQSPVHTIPSPVHQVQTPSHTPVQSFQQQTQTQPILKVQPFQKSQPPVQTVHPQPIQNLHSHQNDPPSNPTPPTSYVVNLTPDQLEQLRRNGQVTVNGQTIFMQRPNKNEQSSEKKLSPKSKPIKKVNKIHAVKNFLNEEPSKPVIETTKEKPVINTLIAPTKPNIPQSHVLPQSNKVPVTQANPVSQPSINVQPSAVIHPSVHQQNVKPTKIEPQKVPVQIKTPIQQAKVTTHNHQTDSNGTHQDVEKLLGQILEESGQNVPPASMPETKPVVPPVKPTQQITTIQLTPQKQQNLRSIQLQIQTLTGRMQPGDVEMQNALKLLFNEQQKILATGKLLPPDKVYYHNNQLTIVNPTMNLPSPVQIKSEPQSPQPTTTTSNNVIRANVEPVNKTPVTIPPIVTTQSHPIPRISVSVPPTSEHSTQTVGAHPVNHLPNHQHQHVHQNNNVPSQRLNVPQIQIPPQPQPAPQQPSAHTQTKKAHLIDQQLTLDQNGAVKPDVHTPFRDKKDACIRLIRYHCLEQPVLSEKDLDKADEIFEMTARHFIGKYSKMVDKYKYLLMKESMRQVQTSELMMLDRMFLAEEQQSLMRLRQDYETQLMEVPLTIPDPEPPPPSSAPSIGNHQVQNSVNQATPLPTSTSVTQTKVSSEVNEVYDEWACIQRELAGLPQVDEIRSGHNIGSKRTAASDSRLETLKRFRVEKNKNRTDYGAPSSVGQSTFTPSKAESSVSQTVPTSQNSSYSSSQEETETENNSIDEQVQSAIDSILNLQQNTQPLDLDSILS